MKTAGGRRRGPVDWAEVRRRVDEAARAIAGVAAPTPERTRDMLEERARTLARPIIPGAEDTTGDAVAFDVRGETYAIDLRDVMAVFRPAEITLLPGAARPLVGVTAWRGELLVILGILRETAGPARDGEQPRVVVVGDGRTAVGIVADVVHGTIKIPHDEVQPLPEGLATRRAYVRGITSEAVQVLDASALLRLHE
jgi:purine-binding chemotaxis protein CheW